MLMDKARLQVMRSKLHHLTILASVLLVARSFSCGVLFSSPDFVEKLKSITKDLTKEFNSKYVLSFFLCVCMHMYVHGHLFVQGFNKRI